MFAIPGCSSSNPDLAKTHLSFLGHPGTVQVLNSLMSYRQTVPPETPGSRLWLAPKHPLANPLAAPAISVSVR